MLRYVYGHDLVRYPQLADSMFRDRAEQFATRLGWAVTVDGHGHERDAYDALDPLYVIWEAPDGSHGGSMRFLPTTGRTMVNDHFAHIAGARIDSPFIWECTRFCISPRATGPVARKAAAALVLGAGEVMERAQLQHFVGVFDPRMERIYRLYGVEPDVIGGRGAGPHRRRPVGDAGLRLAAYPLPPRDRPGDLSALGGAILRLGGCHGAGAEIRLTPDGRALSPRSAPG